MKYLIATLLISLSCTLPNQLLAQNKALIVNPAQDYFDRCKQIYGAAIGTKNSTLKNQYLKQATQYFEDYLRQYPNHENTQAAKYYLGNSYYLLGDIRSARRYLLNVINQYQHGTYVAEAANRLAYNAYSQGNYAEAEPLFEKTAINAKRDEDKERARYLQAQCLIHLKKNAKALDALNIIFKIDNKQGVYYHRSRLQAAHIYKVNKDYTSALTIYTELTQGNIEDSTRTEAMLNAGLCAAKLGQPDLAESHYNAVLTSSEDKFKPQAQIFLLNTYYDKGLYDKVIDLVLNERISLTGDLLAQRSLIMGFCYMQKKNYYEASNFFKLVESAAPGSESGFEAGYHRILCHYNLKRSRTSFHIDEFVANYAVGRGGHKYIHQALFMKAETLYGEKNYTEAVEVYNAIKPDIIAEKNRASLLFKKGWSLSKTGNYDNAIITFSKFIKDYPKDSRVMGARTVRGKAYMALGDRLNALKDFDLIIKSTPESEFGAAALQSSAKLKKDSQNYVDMVRRYQLLLDNHPKLESNKKANAKYWIGWGYFRQKDFANAIAPLQESAELNPEAYGKQAALLLVLCHRSLKDVEALKKACIAATEQGITAKIPLRVFLWLGSQCYSAGEYKEADLYLSLGVTVTNPRQTSKLFWRILSKARVKSSQPEKALEAIAHFLAVEEDKALIADSLLDKASSLFAIESYTEAKKIANEAMAMNPQGRLKAGLRLVLGDIAFQAEDYDTAVKEYIILSNFDGDKTLQPRAIQGAINSLEAQGNKEEAQRYKNMLQEKFPEFLSQ